MSVVFPIEDKPRYATYTATAGQTVFSVPFNFQQTRDVKVQMTLAAATVPLPLVEVTDYVMTGAGASDGGSFTLTTGAAEGDVLEVWGDAVLDRLSSIVQNGKFKATTHDYEHDRHRIIQQELKRDQERVVRGALGYTAPEIKGAPVSGKALVYDGDGNLIPGPDAGDIAAAQPSATVAVQAAQDAEDAKTAVEAMSSALAQLGAGDFTDPVTYQELATFISGLVIVNDLLQVTEFLTVRATGPDKASKIALDKAASGDLSRVIGTVNNLSRWAADFGDSTAEGGSNSGSHFRLKRYNDAGAVIENALTIFRDTGQMLLNGELTFPKNSPIAWGLGNTQRVGNGSPEGVVEANVGSMYLRRDGTPGQTLYIKESNSGLTTGWVAK